MQIKPNEINIDETDPFTKDLLDRQSEIKTNSNNFKCSQPFGFKS